MPTAPMTRVAAGREVAVESERAAPTCKLTATGSREPPINRKSALPPKLVMADRKSTRLNSSHVRISYAVFCLKKKKTGIALTRTDPSTGIVDARRDVRH